MGDRANVKVLQTTYSSPLYLYTHWNGSGWNQVLADALLFGKSEWDDPTYITRILISQMFDDIAHETSGGGVSVGQYPDNEYPILVVDIPTQMVYIEDTQIRESFDSYAKRSHPEMPYLGEVDSILEV